MSQVPYFDVPLFQEPMPIVPLFHYDSANIPLFQVTVISGGNYLKQQLTQVGCGRRGSQPIGRLLSPPHSACPRLVWGYYLLFRFCFLLYFHLSILGTPAIAVA